MAMVNGDGGDELRSVVRARGKQRRDGVQGESERASGGCVASREATRATRG